MTQLVGTTPISRPQDGPIVQWLLRFRFAQIRREWNTLPSDYDHDWPCDRLVDAPFSVRMRAVDIRAPKEAVWPWIGQLRKAPYSYDWIDNAGRRSPRKLTIGADDLRPGQRMMHAMEVVEFEPEDHLTTQMAAMRGFFGQAASTYKLVDTADGCRLIVRVAAHEPGGVAGRLRRIGHPYGELLMLRRQLLNFKELAEHSVHA